MTKNILKLGAHISIAKGYVNALQESMKIGANAMQIFTANQRRWTAKEISKDIAKSFIKTRKEEKILSVASHASYLINLGSPKKDTYEKSIQAFEEEIERCLSLEIDFLIFHPGSYLDADINESMDQIIHALSKFESKLKKSSLRLLFETTAGQGTNIGSTFEELHYLIKPLYKKIPIGICIDTCHIFASGYDIRTKEALNKTLLDFDNIIGLKHLYALHLNDSKAELGSKKDRHENIGKGKIGLDGFKAIMQNSKLNHLPMFLETPNGDKNWADEISLLKKMN
ncbi:MAG TPA: deoxyribonuclease IV [Chlamydiales bacterium]|nr:deoxyribonuclease IV [Chlamydiales bacterium]